MLEYIKVINWKESNSKERIIHLSRPVLRNMKMIKQSVKKIISDVIEFGDSALINYTSLFDRITINNLEISNKKVIKSKLYINKDFKKFIKIAIKNITKFHNHKIFTNHSIEVQPGINCEQILKPINTVGLYIPGGSAPLVSTILMLAIPAKIAKCKEIIMCSPPPIPPEMLYTGKLCGITRFFQVGGAQAIGAMAVGTNSIPKVDKIFGPGNVYVTEAKLQVSSSIRNNVSIDMLAGPSEVLIIADYQANPKFIAADLLSQAEHDSNSQVILVTPELSLARSVILEIRNQIQCLSRKDIIIQSLKNSSIIIASDIAECIDISNIYAPEHLMIQCSDAKKLVPFVINAGSIFIGSWSPVVGGDYVTGTNHVLPTYGSARANSGLTVHDFQKKISLQTLNYQGFLKIASPALLLSQIEGMDAHNNAVKIRLS